MDIYNFINLLDFFIFPFALLDSSGILETDRSGRFFQDV